MNRPTTLLRQVLVNYGLVTRLAIERDIRVIECRFRDEGMSFLTITLPTLDDFLLRGLSEGRVTASMFPGFKPWKRHGSYPALLSGFFTRIFEVDGVLRREPCLDSIEAVRQICRLYKKVELPCSDTRVKQAFKRYHDNEQSISKYSRRSFDSFPNWGAVRSYLWSDLECLSGELYCSPGVFGSGATAEGYRLNQRLSLTEWPTRGECEFPSSYHTASREDDRETFARIKFLGLRDERPIRVVTVPKTLKTPRIIGVEPSYAMLRQQSVWKGLQRYLEGPKFPFKSIRFKDQSENRKLARAGSLDGRLSTIDLSDASDRVSNRLVASTFKSSPSFLRMIFAARTRKAAMPDGELVNLTKFASMGSALCFPIESMVFFTIVLTSMVNQSGMRPSRSVLLRLAKDVAIYGDDIIVPTQMAAGVMRDLELFGLLVNHSKSYSTGFFRESCGGDYYKGALNTPIYVRRLYDNSGKRLDDSTIAAYISLSNQFYVKGLWHVSQYIRDCLANDGIRASRTTIDVGGLTFKSVYVNDIFGYDRTTYQYRVRVWQARTSRHEDPVRDCRAAMLYSFQAEALSFQKEDVWSLEPGFGGKRIRVPDGDRTPSSSVHEISPDTGALDHVHSFTSSDECGTERSNESTSRRELDSYSERVDFQPLVPVSKKPYDGTSVRPYTLKLKCRLTPTPVGLQW